VSVEKSGRLVGECKRSFKDGSWPATSGRSRVVQLKLYRAARATASISHQFSPGRGGGGLLLRPGLFVGPRVMPHAWSVTHHSGGEGGRLGMMSGSKNSLRLVRSLGGGDDNTSKKQVNKKHLRETPSSHRTAVDTVDSIIQERTEKTSNPHYRSDQTPLCVCFSVCLSAGQLTTNFDEK